MRVYVFCCCCFVLDRGPESFREIFFPPFPFFYLSQCLTHDPLFFQITASLDTVKVQPAPVAHVSSAALLAVQVGGGARASRVVKEVAEGLITVCLRRENVSSVNIQGEPYVSISLPSTIPKISET